MRPINIVIFVVAMGFVLHGVRLFVHERTSIRHTLFWSGLWVVIGLFGLFPAAADNLMRLARMESRTFFIVIVGVGLLYRLQYNASREREQHRLRITHLCQEAALLRAQIDDLRGLNDDAMSGPKPRQDKSASADAVPAAAPAEA
jgi:hypothetical protein